MVVAVAPEEVGVSWRSGEGVLREREPGRGVEDSGGVPCVLIEA